MRFPFTYVYVKYISMNFKYISVYNFNDNFRVLITLYVSHAAYPEMLSCMTSLNNSVYPILKLTLNLIKHMKKSVCIMLFAFYKIHSFLTS